MQSDIFSLAYLYVRGNKLCTGLTVAIIAFGLRAFIGIITAIKAMNQKLTESFSIISANGLALDYKEENIQFGRGNQSQKHSRKGVRIERQSNLDKSIRSIEEEQFINYDRFPATADISTLSGHDNIVSISTKKTSTNIILFGRNDTHLKLNGSRLKKGRNFNWQKVRHGYNNCIPGFVYYWFDVACRLFKNNEAKAVNQVVRVNNLPYRVICVQAAGARHLDLSETMLLLSTIKNINRNFGGANSYSIGIKTNDINNVEKAMD